MASIIASGLREGITIALAGPPASGVATTGSPSATTSKVASELPSDRDGEQHYIGATQLAEQLGAGTGP